MVYIFGWIQVPKYMASKMTLDCVISGTSARGWQIKKKPGHTSNPVFTVVATGGHQEFPRASKEALDVWV